MVASFHPELTSDRRLHARFASMVMRRGAAAA
jgi:glutamine amidotransferase PdxT